MVPLGLWSGLLLRLPLWGAYAVGVLVSAMLVSQRRDTPAWLALVGFSALLLASVASWFTGMAPVLVGFARGFAIARAFVCLNVILQLVSAAGVLCLAYALWTGMRTPVQR